MADRKARIAELEAEVARLRVEDTEDLRARMKQAVYALTDHMTYAEMCVVREELTARIQKQYSLEHDDDE